MAEPTNDETREKKKAPPTPEALAEAAEAVARAPRQAKQRLHLANLLFAAGDLAASEVEARAALELRPDHVGAMQRLFAIERDRGEPDAALVWARRIAELQPDRLDAFMRFGNGALAAEEPKQAVAAFARAAELDPPSVLVQRRLAEAYIALPNWGKAVATAQAIADQTPDDAPAQLLLLRACMHYGDFDRTLAAYHKLTALAPNHDRLASLEAELRKIYGRRFVPHQVMRAPPPPPPPWWLRLWRRLTRRPGPA